MIEKIKSVCCICGRGRYKGEWICSVGLSVRAWVGLRTWLRLLSATTEYGWKMHVCGFMLVVVAVRKEAQLTLFSVLY